MVTIKANKYAILIKEDVKVISFPIGSVVVRKTDNENISLMSTISNDRFNCNITTMSPSPMDYRKIEVPDKDDNKKGKKGEVWFSKNTGMYYIHTGDIFAATSVNRIIELFIHKLASYLNGDTTLFK